MSVLQQCREVWQRLQEYAAVEDFDPAAAAVVNRYADETYCLCVRLFGPPIDPQRPYKVCRGERSYHSLGLGNHIIVITKEAKSKEQLCEIVAHEMYHRVTEGRKGLAGEFWVKELMATVTSQWFLLHQGFKGYAEWIKKDVLATEGKSDVNLLQNSSDGSRRYVLSGTPVYSPAFINNLWRTGYALERAVKISGLASIVGANTLEEWVAALPREDQYAACRVLRLPAANKAVPCSDGEVARLFLALQAQGDMEALVSEVDRLVHLQPMNGAILFYLGHAYQGAKRHEEALNAYFRAETLGYADKGLAYNIGGTYWQAGDYARAAEWFQKAIEQTPDWAQPRFHLGQALKRLGDIAAARQVWEEVLTLDDDEYVKRARKALEENPLPDEATQD